MTHKSATRTIKGTAQFCRGGLEAGKAHMATTYTTLAYDCGRVFHFCDEHPADVVTPDGELYNWREDD